MHRKNHNPVRMLHSMWQSNKTVISGRWYHRVLNFHRPNCCRVPYSATYRTWPVAVTMPANHVAQCHLSHSWIVCTALYRCRPFCMSSFRCVQRSHYRPFWSIAHYWLPQTWSFPTISFWCFCFVPFRKSYSNSMFTFTLTKNAARCSLYLRFTLLNNINILLCTCFAVAAVLCPLCCCCCWCLLLFSFFFVYFSSSCDFRSAARCDTIFRFVPFFQNNYMHSLCVFVFMLVSLGFVCVRVCDPKNKNILGY